MAQEVEEKRKKRKLLKDYPADGAINLVKARWLGSGESLDDLGDFKRVKGWLAKQAKKDGVQLVEEDQLGSLARSITDWNRNSKKAMSLGSVVPLARILRVPIENLLTGEQATVELCPVTDKHEIVQVWLLKMLENVRQTSCYVFLVRSDDFKKWSKEAKEISKSTGPGDGAKWEPGQKAIQQRLMAAQWSENTIWFGSSNRLAAEHSAATDTTLGLLINRRLTWVAEIDEAVGPVLQEYGRQDVLDKIFETVRDKGRTQRCDRLPTMNPNENKVCSLAVSFDLLPEIKPDYDAWLVMYHWGPRLHDEDLRALLRKASKVVPPKSRPDPVTIAISGPTSSVPFA